MKDDSSPCPQPAVSHSPDGSIEQLGTMKGRARLMPHTLLGIPLSKDQVE